MTEQDALEFAKLNTAVALAAKAAKALVEGGRALKIIRDRQLYRGMAATWEAYLEIHGLTRRRADQLVSAATVLDAVAERVSEETGTAVPELSERAVRPLAGLDPEQAAEAVIEAAREDGGITPASIRRAVSRRKKAKAPKAPRPRRFKVAGAVVTIVFNRKGTGSAIEALYAALRQAEADQVDQPAAA